VSANGPPGGVVIARNALTSYGLKALLAVNALLLTPYLYRQLGAAAFGTWSVMLSVATLLLLLQVAFATGVSKLVAELVAQQRRDELETTIGAAVVVMAVLGAAAALICAAVAAFAGGLAADSQQGAFRAGMLVLGAGLAVRSATGPYSGALIGYQRYDLHNATWALNALGFLVGAVVAVQAGAGVLGVVIAYAVTLAADGALFVAMLRRADPQLRLALRPGSRAQRRQILRFSSTIALIDSMSFLGRMDTVVIAALRNAAAVAPFATAVKLQAGLQSLTSPFVELLTPMTADLAARGHHDEVVRRFVLATRAGLQVSVPVALGFALFAPDLIHVWLGAGVPAGTAAIIVLLMCVQVVTVATAPAEKVLIGLGRVGLLGALAAVDGLGNVGLSVEIGRAHV